MTDTIDQFAKDTVVATPLLDHLAATTHPDWSTMIDQYRTDPPKEFHQARAADWGRTGGSFFKNIGGGGGTKEEFFKK